MSRQIYFWHGRSKKIESIISKICRLDQNGEYYWDGTLDEFAAAYEGNFIVYPIQICVTEHSDFAQR